MTTATVAAPSGNQFGVLLAIFLVITFITCVVLWVHEQRSDRQGDTLAEHTEQLATLAYQMPALLEFLGIEIPAPVVDDSPAAEEAGSMADVRGDNVQAWRITNAQVSDDVEPDAKAPPGPGDSAKNSPVALGGADTEPSAYDPDASTDEFPVAPQTVPDGMPLVVQSALIERPSPVPRGKSAEWVEAEIVAMRARNAERMARAITEKAS